MAKIARFYIRLLLVELVVMEFRLRQYAAITVYLVQELKFWGGVVLGNNVKVGANAVVTTNMPSNVTCVGIPAKIVKRNN